MVTTHSPGYRGDWHYSEWIVLTLSRACASDTVQYHVRLSYETHQDFLRLTWVLSMNIDCDLFVDKRCALDSVFDHLGAEVHVIFDEYVKRCTEG
jgi:hypothetical protein